MNHHLFIYFINVSKHYNISRTHRVLRVFWIFFCFSLFSAFDFEAGAREIQDAMCCSAQRSGSNDTQETGERQGKDMGKSC